MTPGESSALMESESSSTPTHSQIKKKEGCSRKNTLTLLRQCIRVILTYTHESWQLYRSWGWLLSSISSVTFYGSTSWERPINLLSYVHSANRVTDRVFSSPSTTTIESFLRPTHRTNGIRYIKSVIKSKTSHFKDNETQNRKSPNSYRIFFFRLRPLH